jgi:hypothetical protein
VAPTCEGIGPLCLENLHSANFQKSPGREPMQVIDQLTIILAPAAWSSLSLGEARRARMACR